MTDLDRARAFFRRDPLKYLVHLKYMHLYGDSITCSVMEQNGAMAVLLRYPVRRVVWDAAAYPAAEQVLLPVAGSEGMIGILIDTMRQSGLLERDQVIKFCDTTTEAQMVPILGLTFARALTSYTTSGDVDFEADAAVVIERSPREAHLEALLANGYNHAEVEALFAKGAVLFSLYEGDALLSTCMTYQNFDDVWEVAGVHTHPSARRKGYARRVVQTALWHTLQANRIPRYQVEVVNRASVQLAENLGLRPCLHFTHYNYHPEG